MGKFSKMIRRENGTLKVVVENNLPDMCHQEFKEECDINNIMKRYQQLGIDPTVNRGIYGDLSNVKGYYESVNMVIDAKNKFMLLPAEIRNRFMNDPGMLIDFCNDPRNLEEAIKLGIADSPEPANVNDELNDNGVKAEKVKAGKAVSSAESKS